jgi:nicotinamidase/pyrazinamidase
MTIQPDRDALIIVDQQLDFQPGGALAVAEGDAIVEAINRFAGSFVELVLTQDHHPAGHVSFASSYTGRQPFTAITLAEVERGEVELSGEAGFTMQELLAYLAESRNNVQMLWPDHCVIGTSGESIDPRIDQSRATLLLRKGFRASADSYSAFRENDDRTTGLAELLMARGIERVFVCGLAGDYCVFYTADDAAAAGLAVVYLEDLTRFVGVPQDGRDTAFRRMKESGVKIMQSSELTLPQQQVKM